MGHHRSGPKLHMHNLTMGPTIWDHKWVSMVFSNRGDRGTRYCLQTDRQTDGPTADKRGSHNLNWSLTTRAKNDHNSAQSTFSTLGYYTEQQKNHPFNIFLWYLKLNHSLCRDWRLEALLVCSCLFTYKHFSHRRISTSILTSQSKSFMNALWTF